MTTNLSVTATSADELNDIICAIGATYESLGSCDGIAAAIWAASPAHLSDVLADWIVRYEPYGYGRRAEVSGSTLITPTSGTRITFALPDTAAAGHVHVNIEFCRDSYHAARGLLVELPSDMLVDNGDLPQGWQHRISAAEAIAALDEDRKEAEDIVAKMRSIAPAHWNFYVDGTTVSGGHSVRQYR
jgi:hypothetical protein